MAVATVRWLFSVGICGSVSAELGFDVCIVFSIALYRIFASDPHAQVAWLVHYCLVCGDVYVRVSDSSYLVSSALGSLFYECNVVGAK